MGELSRNSWARTPVPHPMPSQKLAMGTIQGEFAKRQAGVGAKREGPRCQGERESKKHLLQDAPPHLQYKTEKEGRQGQGQPSSSLAQSPYFTFHLLEQEEPRKEVYSPCHLPHLHPLEPLVLFSQPSNPVWGRRIALGITKDLGPRMSAGHVLRTGDSHAIPGSGGPFDSLSPHLRFG